MLVFDVSLNHILSVVVATIVGLVTLFVLFNFVLLGQYKKALDKTTEELQPEPKNMLIYIVFLFLGALTIGWVLNNIAAADLLDAVIVGVMFWIFLLRSHFGGVATKLFNIEAFSIIALADLIVLVLMSLTIIVVGDLMLIPS